MLPAINEAYRKEKAARADNRLIAESVLDADETLFDFDEDFDDIVDPDSVPSNVVDSLNKKLDDIIDSPDYDDTDLEELASDDDEDISLGDLDIVGSNISDAVDESADMFELAEASTKTKTLAAIGGIGGAITGAKSAMNHIAEEDEGYQKAYRKKDEAEQRLRDSEITIETPYIKRGRIKTTKSYISTPETRKARRDYEAAKWEKKLAYRRALKGKTDRIVRGALGGAGVGALSGAAIGKAVSESAYDALTESYARRDDDSMRSEHVSDFGGLGNVINENVDTYSQFVNGKYTMKGGQAYQPISRNQYVTDEARIEQEALRESGELTGLDEWASENGYEAIAEGIGTAVGHGAAGGAIGAGVGGAAGAIRGYMSREARSARKAAKEIRRDPDADAAARALARTQAIDVSKRSAAKYAKKYAAIGGGLGASHGIAHAVGQNRGRRLERQPQEGEQQNNSQPAQPQNQDDSQNQNESSVYALIAEGITNPDAEDYPNQTGAGNDHGARMNDFEAHEAPEDFPNSTGGKRMNSGDEPTDRYKAVAEAISNPDVEDYPGSSGTRTAEGNGYPAGMRHTDDSRIYGYGDESDWESDEVDVEDGGKDVVDVIKANESAYDRYSVIAEEVADSASDAGGTRLNAPGVECPSDFPRSLPNETKGQAAGWGDESDAERREVSVEDGGDDVIDVIKANESAGSVSYLRSLMEAG